MPTRLMIVVAGGSSTRFGSDKLTEVVAGRPLLAHTLSAVVPTVDRCVVVCRADLAESVSEFAPGVVIAEGGSTRTRSEISGIEASAGFGDIVGIHDAARPLVDPGLIDRLFDEAAVTGGAVPVLASDDLLVDRATLEPVHGLFRAQTPQVFRGPGLRAAYEDARRSGFDGYDTADVVQRFTEMPVAAVPGDPMNIKVTYPADLDHVRRSLEGSVDRSRT